MSEFIAHRSMDTTRDQSVLEHLLGTAQIAAEFASSFYSSELGYRCGMLHDIGKYSKEFQKRIRGNSIKVDHSTAGVLEAIKDRDIFCAFCIAGHHGGLPDGGNAAGDTANDNTLWGKLKRIPGRDIPDYSSFSDEVDIPKAIFPEFTGNGNYSDAFFIRMLFSCLVDADFLDTERFMSEGQIDRGKYDSISDLNKRLEANLEPLWDAKNDINRKRCDILKACINASQYQQGLFKLTVPTGGGKTIASLAFALKHAKRHRLKRIIFVIPYTSIIEQTADVFSRYIGRENIIEHHSAIDYDAKDEENDTDPLLIKKRLATENWDAPVIITTAVQFFESIYSNKPSKCRKLHNIAESVIIFDEAQMLPIEYLNPCVAAISQLVLNYRCTSVLCTATQPSLDEFIKRYAPGLAIHEICRDIDSMYSFFRRVSFRNEGILSNEGLAERLNEYKQVLCVVNNRAQAQELYLLLGSEGRYHLSTLVTPYDRRKKLEEIRRRLKNNEACRVVSTSLIEAGVDIDFPVVYRAEAGLDSIIQSAGRCNREGKRTPEESIVHIFKTEKSAPKLFALNISAARDVIDKYDAFDEPEAIEAYFNYLHKLKGDALDAKKIMESWEKGIEGKAYPFATIAEQFKLIDNDTRTVYIPNEIAKDDFDKLYKGERTRAMFRKLGQYSVSIYQGHFKALYSSGAIILLNDGIAILSDSSMYSEDTGLSMTADEGKALFG